MTAVPYIIDALICLLAFGILCLCSARGFLKSLLTFGKTITAIVLSVIFGKSVAIWIFNGNIGKSMENSVYAFFRGLFPADAVTFDISGVYGQIPDSFLNLLTRFGLNEQLVSRDGQLTAATSEQLSEFCKSISKPIVGFVSSVLGYAFVFFAALILLTVIILLSKLLTSLPVIGFFDRTLGTVLGLVLAVVFLVIFAYISGAILTYVSVISPESAWAGVYEKTVVLKGIVGIFR